MSVPEVESSGVIRFPAAREASLFSVAFANAVSSPLVATAVRLPLARSKPVCAVSTSCRAEALSFLTPMISRPRYRCWDT